jgi:cytochrome c
VTRTGTAIAALVLAASLAPVAPAAGASGSALVFTKTAGFRHDGIDEAVDALLQVASERGIAGTHTEDASAFTDARLAGFDVVVFLLTTGDVLDRAQEGALQRFVRGGGGFVGVHSATDTEHDWAWYGDLVGASFVTHPVTQAAVVRVADRRHPSSRHLPARWPRIDEWYEFDRNPRETTHIVATVSEQTYQGGAMGSDHPIAWCHPFEGGRSWYTGMGHTPESYADPPFRAHLGGGLAWAAGTAGGNCSRRSDAEVVSIRLDQSSGAVEGGVFTDRRACRRGRMVVVERVRSRPDRAVARDRADGDGDWRRKGFGRRHGSFRAMAPRDGHCRRLVSGPIRLA